MKKLMCATAMLALMGTMVHAQTTTFGIKGGVQNNFLSIKSQSGGEWSRTVASGVGFQAGGVADISFSEHFSIQPNLLFSLKSVKPTSISSINLYTIDLPINFVYKHNGFFAGIGPNLSYGLSAKQKEEGDPDDDLYEEDSPGSDPELNRFEFGANATIGYQCPSGLTLAANYTPGFSNLNNQPSGSDLRYNTRIFGFTIGYMFNAKKPAAKK